MNNSVNRKVKDSVFSSLFGEKKYILQLYKVLHPESEATEDDLTNVTLDNAIVDTMYNDLGFMVDGRLIVLVEAQSTWSPNILIRGLLYLCETYKRQLGDPQRLYGSKKVKLPRAEMYVLYTGNSKACYHRQVLSLTDEFFGGSSCSVDASVKVLCCGTDETDIISQYVHFCKVITEQIRLYGRTREALEKALEICSQEKVLQEFLTAHETEVFGMYEWLFDEDLIRKGQLADAKAEGKAEMVCAAYKNGSTVEQLMQVLNLSHDEVAAYLATEGIAIP